MLKALKEGHDAVLAALKKAPTIGTITIGKTSANVKWARDAMVGRLLRDTMDSMSLRRPKVSRKIAKQKIR